MRIVRRVTATCLCVVAFAGLGGGAADARTPTPTPTSVPVSTATPSPQPAVFGGQIWVNARIVGDRDVTARIGDTVCGTASPPYVSPPGVGAPVYSVFVSSDEAVPGCGREGAVVTFFVGGQQARQSAIWHVGQQTVSLIVGPPFARFFIYNADIEWTTRAGGAFVPYVGNKACGYGDRGGVVYSNEQEPGCGVEGSQVTFKLVDAQGSVTGVANQTGIWHAWDAVSDPQKLSLTFTPGGGITMPATGMGDGPDGEGSVWGQVSLVLGFVGLTGAALGLALRRRAMTR